MEVTEKTTMLTKIFERPRTYVDGKRRPVTEIEEHTLDLYFDDGRPCLAEWTFADECEHIGLFFQEEPKTLSDYDGIADLPPPELLDWLKELGYSVPDDFYEVAE